MNNDNDKIMYVVFIKEWVPKLYGTPLTCILIIGDAVSGDHVNGIKYPKRVPEKTPPIKKPNKPINMPTNIFDNLLISKKKGTVHNPEIETIIIDSSI